MKKKYMTFAITTMVAILSMIPVFAKTQRVFTTKQLESENHIGFIGHYETVNEDGSPVEYWESDDDHVTAFKEGDLGKVIVHDGYRIEYRPDGYWSVDTVLGREDFYGPYDAYDRTREVMILKDGRCVYDLSPDDFKKNAKEISGLIDEYGYDWEDKNILPPEELFTREQEIIMEEYYEYVWEHRND